MALPLDQLTAPALADAPHLPPPAPLEMPVQSLHQAPRAPDRLPSSPRAVGVRRAFVIVTAIAMTGVAAWQMLRVLDVGGITTLIVLLLVLYVALFAWIAFSFASCLGGFVSCLRHGGRRLGIDLDKELPKLGTRVALLMPTYNEPPGRIMAGIEAMHRSLVACNADDAFDIFILSDTTNPDVWIEEEAAFLALRTRIGSVGVYYRHRPQNTGRKAGNIADWVRRFGGAYPQMMILDADSVMSGEAIVRLAAAMERHQDVGLIQTLPIIVNGATLFARMQQFAGRVYGPLIAHGIAWWHGAEGNYWGHNAMIRTRAFAEQAGLPTLRGPKPFGGHILSHDFIEAALLRRGGWAVHMVPGLPGSYEESPPSLQDLAARDRRWCQGNLQHAAVLPARGLHWVSRLHLLNGIGSYVTAPIWLAFLIIGILISLQARFIRPDYFPNGKQLFPTWPIIDPERAKMVFIGTMIVLLAPKLLAYLILLTDRTLRRGCGGGLRALLSVLAETIIAGLLAPITMLTQSLDIGSILIGRDSGWNAQRRDDGSIPLRQVIRRFWGHTAFGLALALFSFLVSPYLFAWMTPVVLGQALAIPLAAWTASLAAGQGAARIGLLRIPEEAAPPPVLRDALACRRGLRTQPTPAIERLFGDPTLLAVHRRMLPPQGIPAASLLSALARLDAAADIAEAAATLSPEETVAVLGDSRGLDALEKRAGATAGQGV
jgi:membrane glycosyltransferase